MAAFAQLRLTLPVDQARNAVAAALAAQGFAVQLTPTGSLDVSRGSLGTTLVAGALAGQDMHVRFDVRISEDQGGALAEFEHSSVGGFFKGGAIGASKAADVVREAAHATGIQLAQQGVLQDAAPTPVPNGQAPTPPPPQTSAAPPPPQTPVPPQPPYAGYPGYGGYPPSASIPPAIDYANRTNVVAIVALILGFLVPIGGIIAGAVGLAQIKRTGERGRGLAIGGIIAGSILTVLGVIAVILLFVLAAITAAQDAAYDASTPPSQGSDEVPDGDGGVTGDVFALQIGECLDDVPTGYVSDVNVIDCATPHTFEVYTDFTIPGDTLPTDDELATIADDGCYAAFPDFVGLSYEESTLDYVYLTPSAESWDAGDRLVSCLISDTAGETTGTLAGSAR